MCIRDSSEVEELAVQRVGEEEVETYMKAKLTRFGGEGLESVEVYGTLQDLLQRRRQAGNGPLFSFAFRYVHSPEDNEFFERWRAAHNYHWPFYRLPNQRYRELHNGAEKLEGKILRHYKLWNHYDAWYRIKINRYNSVL